jgi:hypothetical protein
MGTGGGLSPEVKRQKLETKISICSVLGSGVGLGANKPPRQKNKKNKLVTNLLTGLRTWTDSLDKRPKRRNMDMTFGIWHLGRFQAP